MHTIHRNPQGRLCTATDDTYLTAVLLFGSVLAAFAAETTGQNLYGYAAFALMIWWVLRSPLTFLAGVTWVTSSIYVAALTVAVCDLARSESRVETAADVVLTIAVLSTLVITRAYGRRCCPNRDRDHAVIHVPTLRPRR